MDFSSYANKVNLLCYNIFYQRIEERHEIVEDLILKNDPDVLCLQEVSLEWIPYLQAFMEAHGYSYYGYGRKGGEMSDPEPISGDQFVPVLWKTEKYDLVESGHFWLSSTPEVYSSDWIDGSTCKYPRCVNWVILKDKATGGEFLTMNIHLAPDAEYEGVRSNSCRLITEKLEEYRGGRPAVVCGDWNIGLSSNGYDIMTRTFKDVRFVAEQADKFGSFNGWDRDDAEQYAYGDHIFVTDNMASELFEVVDDVYDGEHASDHNPLRTVLYY